MTIFVKSFNPIQRFFIIFFLKLFVQKKVHIHNGPCNLKLGIKPWLSIPVYISELDLYEKIGNIMTTNFCYAFMSALSELIHIFFLFIFQRAIPKVCIFQYQWARSCVKSRYLHSLF